MFGSKTTVRLMSTRLKDIMVEDVITVNARATVKTAAAIMNKHEIGCLIVADKEKAVGIVTERDILKRVIPKSEAPEKIRVTEIMSKPLLTAKPEMEISEAAKIMFTKNVKKLPVVEQGCLVGLVTLTDLIRSPNVLRWLEKYPVEKAPKKIKNVINTFLEVDHSGKRCPLIVEHGYVKRCRESMCMWWLGDRCAITELSRQISDMKKDS